MFYLFVLLNIICMANVKKQQSKHRAVYQICIFIFKPH